MKKITLKLDEYQLRILFGGLSHEISRMDNLIREPNYWKLEERKQLDREVATLREISEKVREKLGEIDEWYKKND